MKNKASLCKNIQKDNWSYGFQFLANPQRNLKETIGFDLKITFHTQPTPHKLNVSNRLTVTDPILINLKRRFLWTSRTDSNCHIDICPGNINPGNIFLYQEHFSFYWPNFDQILKVSSWDLL